VSDIIRRKEFLLGLVILVSIFIYVPYFFEVPELVTEIETWLITTTLVILSVAIWIGVYTLSTRQIMRARRGVRGWQYGIWMIILAWLMIFIGIFLGRSHPLFMFFADAFVIPGDATIYAILVFYLTSSAARAFKVRDLESFLLMLTTFIVIFKQAPLGELLAPWLAPLGTWLTNYLAMAATRVFGISAALGGIVLAVRLLAGKEMAMIGLIRRKEEE
jgi:hypothetical protein